MTVTDAGVESIVSELPSLGPLDADESCHLVPSIPRKSWPHVWAAGAIARRDLLKQSVPQISTDNVDKATSAAAVAEAQALIWSASLRETRKKAEEEKEAEETAKLRADLEVEEHAARLELARQEAEVERAEAVIREAALAEQEVEYVALEAKAKEEGESFLRERRQQVASLEADAREKGQAVEFLYGEINEAERCREMAVARAKSIRNQWAELAKQPGRVNLHDMESRLRALEEEEQRLLKTVEELEADMNTMPEVEKQRIWWLERVARLELETKERRRQLAPFLEQCEALEEQRRADAKIANELRSRLGMLEEIYASVGVDVHRLCGADGSLDPIDVSLAICLAVMPPRGLDFAAGREPEPYRGESPALMPSRQPLRRERSHDTSPPQRSPPSSALPSVLLPTSPIHQSSPTACVGTNVPNVPSPQRKPPLLC